LSEDVPENVVSDQMNKGRDVPDKHYVKRSEQVKMKQRRAYLDDTLTSITGVTGCS
jgi:hypothetical protein